MSKLGVVEDTLFVPMLGRIYASEYCPQILYDPKALELKKKLPSSLPEQDGQSQYTLLASAARSANMDRYIRAFLEHRPDGVIVQLGCGLETAYYRCDNGRSRWYAVDLPHVVEYRRELLPEPELLVPELLVLLPEPEQVPERVRVPGQVLPPEPELPSERMPRR